MEDRLIEQAKKSLQLADHLLIGTYPLVKDPKLLLGVLTNIYDAHKNMVVCMLRKTIVPLQTEQAQLEQFKKHFATKISKEEMQSIVIIYDLIKEHKSSAVEFARKQKLVMCDNHYEFHSLSFDTLKKHLRHAQSLHKKLLNV